MPTKHVRCMFYDADGKPVRSSGCPKTSFCDFVHPSDPGWASAELPRPRRQPRDNQNSAGTWPNARQTDFSNVPSGPRRGSNASSASSWNQYAAATVGRPVDSGWGAAPKRKASGWDGGGTNGVNTSSSSSWDQGGGWDAGASRKGSTRARTTDNNTFGSWGDSGASWGLANNKPEVSVGWGPAAQDMEESSDKGTDKGAETSLGGEWGATASGWQTMVGLGWGAPAVWNTVANGKDTAMGDAKNGSSSNNAVSAWDVGVSASSRTQGASSGGANNGKGKATEWDNPNIKDTTWAKRKDSSPVVTSSAWDRPASISSKTQERSSSGWDTGPAWSSTGQSIDSSWGAEPALASSISIATGWGAASSSTTQSVTPGPITTSPIDIGSSSWEPLRKGSAGEKWASITDKVREEVTVDPIPFGASTATWLNGDEDMQMDESQDVGPSILEKESPSRHNRRRSNATLNSRDSSPRRTRTPRKLTTRQEYIEVLCRALHQYSEWKSAEDAVADTVRMQNSEYYRTKSLGDRAADILNQSRKEREVKAHAAKRKFEEYLEQLEVAPPPAALPNAATSEEESLQMKEIWAAVNEIKAGVHGLQVSSLSSDNAMNGGAAAGKGKHSTPTGAGSVIPGDGGLKLTSAASKLQDRLGALEDYFVELRGSHKKALADRLHGVDVFGNVRAVQLSVPEAELERLREHDAVIQHEVEKQSEDLAVLKREVQQLRESATLVKALQAENEGLKTRQAQMEQSHAALTGQLQSCTTEIETLKAQVKALTERSSAQPAFAITMDPNALVPLLEPMVRDRTRLEAQDALQTVTTSLQESLDKQQKELCQTMWIGLRPTLRLLDAIHDTMEQAKHSNTPLSQLIPTLPHAERNES